MAATFFRRCTSLVVFTLTLIYEKIRLDRGVVGLAK